MKRPLVRNPKIDCELAVRSSTDAKSDQTGLLYQAEC
jgi:hypothetical protein